MSLTVQQNLESRPIETEPWTIRNLFPTKALTNVVAKTFTSVFDVLLTVSVLGVVVSEILHNDVSPWMVTVTLCLLIATFKTKESERELENSVKEK